MDFHDHKIGAKDISFRQHHFKAKGICHWRFARVCKKGMVTKTNIERNLFDDGERCFGRLLSVSLKLAYKLYAYWILGEKKFQFSYILT